MNFIYRTVWNAARRAWQVTAETGSRVGKKRGGGTSSPHTLRLPALAAGSLLLVALPALALDLPSGGRVVAGQGSIDAVGNTLTVQQDSQKLAIDWQNFSIGADHRVQFVQPNAQAAALNRVTGDQVSQVRGALSANGRVFLVNPNGVLFSSSAQVDVGALVASTLDIGTDDFMAGDYHFSGNSAGAVINQGRITAAEGGHVALIAARIINTGSIDTPRGSTLMGAGSVVTLDLGGPVRIEVEEALLETYIEQGGAIRADGGLVYLTARAADDLSASVINHSGVTRAHTLASGEDGRIFLMGDMDSGALRVAGTLDASAPVGGDGGFIETSAAQVRIADDVRVTTLAANGHTGTWLIDPTDFTVSAGTGTHDGSGIGANTLMTSLASNNVVLETLASGGENGDIHVNAAVTWNANTTLTLNAHNDIFLNAPITVQHTGGGLALNHGGYGHTGTVTGGTGYHVRAPVSFTAGTGGSFSVNGNGYTLVHTLNALQAINSGLSGRYALATDIDAGATASWNDDAGFVPIGNTLNPFTGTFDGLGHSISGLFIHRPSTVYVGLFGLTHGATLRHVGLEGVNITGLNNVGGLAGTASSSTTIRNSYASGSVEGAGSYTGGLVGYNYAQSTISNSYATGSVTGNNHVGGLVGINDSSATISNSYATGRVTGDTLVGGLVGYNVFSSISNSYATGRVTGNNQVGGLVGGNDASIGISNSYWDRETTGQDTACGNSCSGATGLTTDGALLQASYGGFDFGNHWFMIDGETRPFLRMEHSTTIRNGHQLQLMAMDLSAHYTLAQDIDLGAVFAGDNRANLWATSSTEGRGFMPVGDNTSLFSGTFDGLGHVINGLVINRSTQDLVGLFGVVGGGGIIRNVGLEGVSVTGNNVVGGLVGRNFGTITQSYTTGGVFGNTSVGGLVGENNGSITQSYATGGVTGSGNDVGGLVGGNSGNGSITQSYATGGVFGNNSVGGLVGRGSAGGGSTTSITQSYATGGVSGNDAVGGLVGTNESHIISAASITQSYATGGVSGNDAVGGLVGQHLADTGTASITQSYATGSVTGNGAVGGLVGHSQTGSGGGTTSITQSYWNTETTGRATSAGSAAGFGKTTEEMMQQGTFTGWDYAGVWGITEGVSYPWFQWQYGSGAGAGPQVVSGTAVGAGGGQSVSLALNGAVLNNVNTGANGFYYFTLPGGTYAAGDTLLTGLGGPYQGAHLRVAPTGTSQTGMGLQSEVAAVSGAAANHGLVSGLSLLLPAITYDGTALDLGGLTLRIDNGVAYDLTGSLTAAALHFGGTLAASGAVDVDTFTLLAGGNWVQNADGASLHAFHADDFRLEAGSTFLRAFDGDGTAGTPWLLTDIYGLQGVATQLAGHYALANNIDATGTAGWNDGVGFAPIGNFSNPFTGTVDGLDRVINGLTINRPTQNFVGLVGYTTSASQIRNLGLVGGSVSGSTWVGGLVGHNSGSITRSYTTGDVTGAGSVGGLVGRNNGSITQSYATGSVSGSTSVGGLVGVNSDSTVSNSYAAGSVTGNNQVGGLVGNNIGDSTISNGYATGSVAGNAHVGGLVGANELGATVSNSYATGPVTGNSQVGGLVGANTLATVSNSYWDRETTGRDTSAGSDDSFGKTTDEMMNLATFAGWDISANGGESTVWRIYQGHSAPLLRSFLQAVTVTADATSFEKEYDGSTSGTAGSYTTSLGNLDLGSLIYTSSSANAGTYGSGDLVLGGLFSGQQGYDISYDSAATSLIITPRTLTVSGTTAAGRQYDGTTQAAITAGTLHNLVAGETLGVSATGVFGSANAGSRTATASYILTDGSGLAGNYRLDDTTGHTATIEQRVLNIIDVIAENKVYDGTAAAALSNAGRLDAKGLVGDETLILDTEGLAALFEDAGVGTNKTVTVSGYSLSDGDNGGLADNYVLSGTPVTTRADITPAGDGGDPGPGEPEPVGNPFGPVLESILTTVKQLPDAVGSPLVADSAATGGRGPTWPGGGTLATEAGQMNLLVVQGGIRIAPDADQ